MRHLWALAATAAVAARSTRRLRLPAGPLLNATVLRQAEDNLALAEKADYAAANSNAEAKAVQQQLQAAVAEGSAEEAYRLGEPAIPESFKGRDRARMFEAKTKFTVKKIKDVEAETRLIAKEAAEAATDKVVKEVAKEAGAAAEAADKANADWKKSRAKRVAANVAAAMEPYFLAMLRSEKAAAQTHAKAMGAAEASLKLGNDAQEMASQAQGLQAAGLGIQAQQLMMMAHGAMTGAANLKGQAEKLYALSNKINGGTGVYQLYEGMAAQTAAATTLYNAPMELPPE